LEVDRSYILSLAVLTCTLYAFKALHAPKECTSSLLLRGIGEHYLNAAVHVVGNDVDSRSGNAVAGKGLFHKLTHLLTLGLAAAVLRIDICKESGHG